MQTLRTVTLIFLALSVPVLPQQFGVKVEEIVVNVLVTDREGQPIEGLQKEDFRLYEGRVEQEISRVFQLEAPFSIGLVLDSSQSIQGRIHQIQGAAAHFASQLHPQDEVMVLSFDSEVYLDSEFTRNRENIDRAIRSTRTGGNETHLYEAVFLGIEQVEQQPYRKIMVLFTDGMDVGSADATNSETIEVARESEVMIFTIFFNTMEDAINKRLGIAGGPGAPTTPGTIPGSTPLPTPDREPSIRTGTSPMERDRIRRQLMPQYAMAERYLADLAKATGGRSFEVRHDLRDLDQAFEKILDDLRALYSLTYAPSTRPDQPEFRKIEVRVDRKDARVRHRSGYLARPK